MEVLGSKEGYVYELDMFNNMEDDDIGYYSLHHHKRRHLADSGSSAGSSIMTTNFDNQIVLLGFCQTNPVPICNGLNSKPFDVTVVQESSDVLQFAKSKQPSVIILDEILIGSTAFEVCEEIQNMGAWGEYVNFVYHCSSKKKVMRLTMKMKS